MSEPSEAQRLTDIAARLVEQARKRGADVAEASASSGWELTAKVRLGQPELVQEAGTRSVALRVMKDQRVAITSTSDWTPEGLERAVSDALGLVELSERDEFAGPADPPVSRWSSTNPTAMAVGMVVTMPQLRRRPKYLPRERSGTRSAIQLTQAGLPIEFPQYISRMSNRKPIIAGEVGPPPCIRHSALGSSAIGIHISRWE